MARQAFWSIYMWLALFFFCIPLYSTLVPSQITWFPLLDTHKSCAFPKCSSPTSHNVSHTPWQIHPSVQKVMQCSWINTGCVTPWHWGWRCPDSAGRYLDKVLLPLNPSFGSCLLLCSVLLWDCGDGLWWAGSSWGRVGLDCGFAELNASVTSTLAGEWGGGHKNTTIWNTLGKRLRLHGQVD